MKATKTTIGIALVSFLSGACLSATAQQPDPGVLLGAWFGGEAIPQALDPGCGNTSGTEGGWTFGAHISVPIGPLLLEGRVSRHSGADYLCPGVLVDRTGVHTIRTPDLPFGDFTKTDARLRLDLGPWFVVGLGAGWAWSKDVPYLTSSVGARAGDSVRFGADLELTSYRIAWRGRTSEFDEGGEEVRVLARDFYHDWGGAFSLRFVLEVPVGAIR
jgi:hypothetical protein